MLYVKKYPWMGLWVDVLVARSKRATAHWDFMLSLWMLDNSARGQLGPRQVGPYVKTTRTVLLFYKVSNHHLIMGDFAHEYS